MKRRPVFRVFVSWGRRAHPREFNVSAPTVVAALRAGLALARAAQLAPPHYVDGVVHLCDLDQVPRAKRKAVR